MARLGNFSMQPSFRGVVWFAWGCVALLLAASLTLGLYREPDRDEGRQAIWQSLPARPNDAGSAASPAAQRPGLPSFDIVSVDQRGQAVIAGRALPGDRVRVFDSETPIG